jgi:sec-independent protein translocase protein TatA
VVNVGPLELILVLIIALIVLGPQRLPEVARSVGRGMREFRSALASAGDDEDEEDDEDDEIPDIDADPEDEIEPPDLPTTPPGDSEPEPVPGSPEDLPERS